MKRDRLYFSFLCLCCFLFCALDVQAQQDYWKGQVKDAVSGEPMIGVSVRVKGTGSGTITDFDPFSGLAGSGSFIDNCFFYFYLSGIAEPPGSGPVASIYSYSRDTKYNFAVRYTSVDKFSKYFTLSTAIHG